MKDLSKAERLEQEILEMAEKCGDKKWLRVKRTFFVLSGVVYLVVFICGGMNNIKDFLLWLIGAPITATFIMFISSIILLHITTGAMEDEKAISKKIGELNAIKFSEYE